MNELAIAVKAKDMGGEAGLKALQRQAENTEGALDELGGSADRASRKLKDGGASADDSAGRLDRVGESADNTEGKFTGLASGIDGVTSLMDDPSPQEFAQGLADIADGVGNFLIPTLKMMSVELLKNIGHMARSAAASAAAAATTVAGWIAAGATAAVNAAIVVASWIAMALQAAISAAGMALAWVIAMGPIILAIAAVIAIIYLLIRNWDTVKEVAVAALNFIWQTIQGVFDWIASNWPLILAILTGPIGLAVLAIVKNWDTIKEAFGAVKDFIVDAVTGIKDWIVNKIQQAIDGALLIFNAWKDGASRILNGIVDLVTGMPGRITSAARGMFDGITDAMRNAINGIITIWNNLSFTLPKINIPSVDVPGLGKIGGGSFGGQTFSTPNLPYAAAGGIRSGAFIAGERGAELIDGAAGVRVRPAGETRQLLGQGAGQTINVYIQPQGSIHSTTDLMKTIRREIERGAIPGLGVTA